MHTNESVSAAMSYGEYRHLIDTLMAQHMTTGTDQSEAMLDYAKLNLQRMKRLDKTILLQPEVKSVFENFSTPYTWLVLSEGWCGDAAQILPILHLLAQSAPAIDLKILLRDEHLDLMDRHLTNGGRAIPKVIVLNKEGEELASWGPRPQVAQNLMDQWKTEGLSKEEKNEKLHAWYTKDKGIEIQREFMRLMQGLHQQ